MNRHDPRVLKLRSDLRLGDELVHQLVAVTVAFLKQLDGDVAVQLGIESAVDDSHSSPGDHLDELKRVGRVAQRESVRCAAHDWLGIDLDDRLRG